MSVPSIPTRAYIFRNGMCMVFDYKGEQIGDLQGYWHECRPKIIAHCEKHAILKPLLRGGTWDSDDTSNGMVWP